ncbi:MAG: hypothetical protein LW692_04745 [Sphingobacteriales bacterium]|nr:hypothetical protein [Sphingobacteriales bacterium]
MNGFKNRLNNLQYIVISSLIIAHVFNLKPQFAVYPFKPRFGFCRPRKTEYNTHVLQFM